MNTAPVTWLIKGRIRNRLTLCRPTRLPKPWTLLDYQQSSTSKRFINYLTPELITRMLSDLHERTTDVRCRVIKPRELAPFVEIHCSFSDIECLVELSPGSIPIQEFLNLFKDEKTPKGLNCVT